MYDFHIRKHTPALPIQRQTPNTKSITCVIYISTHIKQNTCQQHSAYIYVLFIATFSYKELF